MGNKFKMVALAALVMGVGVNAFAEGEGEGEGSKNTAVLTTSIEIKAAEVCSVDVSAEQSKWALDWYLKDGAKDSGELFMGKDHGPEPLFVKVQVTKDSSPSCNLNGMKFSAGLATSEHIGEAGGAFRAKTKVENSFWRYMPVVAKLSLFTSVEGATDGATGLIPLDKVKVTDAAGVEHVQQAKVQHKATTEVSDLVDFGSKPAVALTDNYLAANGSAPLSIGAEKSLGITVGELEEGASVQSARIGVGALVAKNPENESGDLNLAGVTHDEEVSLPFTVSVTVK